MHEANVLDEHRQLEVHEAKRKLDALRELVESPGWLVLVKSFQERRDDAADSVLRNRMTAEEREARRQVFLALDDVLTTPEKMIDHLTHVVMSGEV